MEDLYTADADAKDVKASLATLTFLSKDKD
jgi:hypothetical protein